MIKRIGLTYDEERYNLMKEGKEASGKSWEDFFFDLAFDARAVDKKQAEGEPT